MMKARSARRSDCAGILKLAREAHKSSRFKKLAFNEAACLDAIQRHIGFGLPPSIGATALFVVGGEKIEAALGATCTPLYGCLGATLITDTFWFSSRAAHSRSGLEVLAAFHRWAAQCDGPYVIRQGVTDFIAEDPSRAGALLGRKGFRKAGHIYEKDCL